MKHQRDQAMFDWDAYNRVEPADPHIDPIDKRRVSRQAMAILSRLREGPATNGELLQIAARYGARIHELRKAGYQIPDPVRVSGGTFRYELKQEPKP